MKKRVFFFGIDGAPPRFISDWLEDLPNIKKIIQDGIYARMETSKPPISITAWTSLFSGRDPGETGIYNYTERYYQNKTDVKLTDSKNIKTPMVWDILGEVGKKNIVLNVISSSPVTKINGIMLSGLLTSEFNEQALYPYNLKREILEICGGKYLFDVSESFTYRKFDLDELINKVYEMTETQIKLVKHFIKTREWDFFAYTLMGSDRFHHRLWSYVDEKHRDYKPDSKYNSVIKEYYKYLDAQIGEIRGLCSKDTVFIIASDHGMNRLDGRINLNDWLKERGYLVFKDEYLKRAKENGPIKFDPKEIDWEKTSAFATSAYESLVFVNREALADDYEKFCKKLANEIAAIPGKDGQKLDTKVFAAKDIYPNGFDANAPDMIVYLDNLFWGTNCDIGNKGLYSLSNLVGADDALHGRKGIFIAAGEGIKHQSVVQKIDILDITPTILNLFGLEKEKTMRGKNVLT